VLLSALVLPGLGQLAQRRYLPGAIYALGSLGLIGVLLQRLYVEVQLRLPSDPDELLSTVLGNPSWPFQLADSIQRDNAGFFGGITAGIVLLWLLSVVDAWRTSARSAVEHRPAGRVE
jgi:hypothetical protein